MFETKFYFITVSLLTVVSAQSQRIVQPSIVESSGSCPSSEVQQAIRRNLTEKAMGALLAGGKWLIWTCLTHPNSVPLLGPLLQGHVPHSLDLAAKESTLLCLLEPTLKCVVESLEILSPVLMHLNLVILIA